ncbi:MAG: glycoside hydrolase family 25 protein [Lachnospiraceae bacterium]|nr:glycoside hydrolase family 25 protein [Lachnospiraceae bacterium]
MREKKNFTLSVFVILMVIVTIMSLTFAGITGALYIRQRDITDQLLVDNEKLQSQSAVEVFSFDKVQKENTDAGNIISDENDKENAVQIQKENIADENIISSETDKNQENAVQIQDETLQSVKQKMKDLLTAEDGSPLKMIREFFPENLIYYDEKEYYFAPVLDEVKKHNLVAENFVKNDKNEMEYIVNGDKQSHKGIDVSKYQGDIDWEKVSADGVEYAFVRLGVRGYQSGKIVADEYFDQNMRGACDAGIRTGVYFFTQAVNTAEALEEANFVIESIKNYDVTCPVVFDVEHVANSNARANELSQQERTDITIAFCNAIRDAGYIPMIYGNVKCFTKMLDMTRLNEYEKWYAFYDDYMYMPYDVSCWQYTEKGKVKGISGNVDMNISYKLW